MQGEQRFQLKIIQAELQMTNLDTRNKGFKENRLSENNNNIEVLKKRWVGWMH